MNNVLNSKVVGDGKSLIILHGLFGMLNNWQGLAKQFGQFFETHILDQRNHGDSFHADEHNYELMCLDLLHYLDVRDLDKVYLMGHSMGGKTAMLFAMMFPERVEKLVVVDISPKYYAINHREILTGLHEVEKAQVKSRKEADEILSRYLSAIEIRQFLLKNLYWKNKKDLLFKFNLSVLSREIENMGKTILGDLLFIKTTLFINGETSNYILEEDFELIEKHFPDVEFVKIANAGHWPHIDNPKDFFNEVNRFLI